TSGWRSGGGTPPRSSAGFGSSFVLHDQVKEIVCVVPARVFVESLRCGLGAVLVAGELPRDEGGGRDRGGGGVARDDEHGDPAPGEFAREAPPIHRVAAVPVGRH